MQDNLRFAIDQTDQLAQSAVEVLTQAVADIDEVGEIRNLPNRKSHLKDLQEMSVFAHKAMEDLDESARNQAELEAEEIGHPLANKSVSQSMSACLRDHFKYEFYCNHSRPLDDHELRVAEYAEIVVHLEAGELILAELTSMSDILYDIEEKTNNINIINDCVGELAAFCDGRGTIPGITKPPFDE